MKRDLQTVTAFADGSPFTLGQLRWWLFNSKQNGLDDHAAIVRIGRRVYIDVAKFDAWIESQQVAA